MGSISALSDNAKDLTIVTASGRLKAEEFIEWLKAYYAGARKIAPSHGRTPRI